MIRLLTIAGTRPQFVKASAIHRCIRNNFDETISETLLHTGQHYDIEMSGVFFCELDLPLPVYNLETGPAEPPEQISRMIAGTAKFLKKEKPDMVLVYGDTNSTFAGAVAASRLEIPLIHVEAGLRSGNKYMQEEMNRILTDQMATLLFAPTPVGMKNLQKEGFNIGKKPFNMNNPGIFLSGDVMLDNFMHYRTRAKKPAGIENLSEQAFGLLTIHRAEVTRNMAKLQSIINGAVQVAKKRKIRLLFPLHPSTRQKAKEAGLNIDAISEVLLVIPPVSYLETLWLLTHCKIVFTDSGGLQKEAAFSDKPCIVLRDVTEWTELEEAGLCITGGFTLESIQKAAQIADNPIPGKAADIFGNGRASLNICKVIESFGKQITKNHV